jgi:hypothetical protein
MRADCLHARGLTFAGAGGDIFLTMGLSELSDDQSEDRSQATNLLTQVHRGP